MLTVADICAQLDAEKLMQHQPSFRAKKSFSEFTGRAADVAGGSWGGCTVIGGGGAKAMAKGKGGGRGMSAREPRELRGKFDKVGRMTDFMGTDEASAQQHDAFRLQTEEFPDLDEGTELVLNQPKKVECGKYLC
jgi:hypothetical protein